METWADELANTLQIECEVLKELSLIAEKKTGVIVDGDTAMLDNIMNYEQPLIMHLQNIEQIRLEILKKAKMEKLTLSQVAAKSSQEQKELFLNYLNIFYDVSGKLKRTNDLNNKLVRSRLDLYEKLKLIQNNNTYISDGKTHKTEKKPALLDKKV